MITDTTDMVPAPTAGAGCPADTIPGVLTGMNDRTGVQRCDGCKLYDGDLDAALALAALIPGAQVRYHEFHADYSHAGPIRTYDGSDDTVMVAYDTDPWIEVDGRRIDWSTYRLPLPVQVTLARESRESVIVMAFKVTSAVPDATYDGKEFQPSMLQLVYRHAHDGTGWTCEINLVGPRRLKDGSLGDSHVKTWWSRPDQAPAWAILIAQANAPGQLAIDGQPV